MRNNLSGRYNFSSLCGFAWPTIIMLIFMALYTMVDGAFVARLIGTEALSAVNIVYPVINLYVAAGIMLGTGGSAIVARQLGEGKREAAGRNFTLILIAAVVSGLAITAAGLIFLDPLLRLLGADGTLLPLCRQYAGTLLPFVPVAVAEMVLQSFFVAAGRPGYGLAAVVAGGVANMVLDYVFIGPLGMGMMGAALATGIGYIIPAVFGLWYFARNGKASFGLARPVWNGPVLLEACVNGSSEMVTNLSLAVVTFLFNRIMLRHLGVEGVAAMTIVLYAEYLLCSIYFGFSTGVAPLFSYQHGKGNASGLRKLFRNSLALIALCSAAAVILSLALAGPIVSVFSTAGSAVHEYATNGFGMFALAFVFMGFNIFASALFTALSNGRVSALLSLLRTFVFIAAALAILPRLIGVNGIWLAVPVAEAASIALSAWYLWRYRNTYSYA